jgi:sec-independent protein translocase protein TatA
MVKFRQQALNDCKFIVKASDLSPQPRIMILKKYLEIIMFGISPVQLLIILAIIILLFGTKKLRGMGGDLGGALKGFKKAMKDDDEKDADFKNKEKVADKSSNSETTATTKSEQKESN